MEILGVFPGGASGKEPACQCKRCKRLRFDPWVRKIPWKRKWQPTSLFLPGKSHGQRSLAGYSPWDCKESNMTEHVCIFHTNFGGFPGGASGKEPICQCQSPKRLRFDPWVRKIPWRRAWQPTPMFLLGESHGQSSLAGYGP